MCKLLSCSGAERDLWRMSVMTNKRRRLCVFLCAGYSVYLLALDVCETVTEYFKTRST